MRKTTRREWLAGLAVAIGAWLLPWRKAEAHHEEEEKKPKPLTCTWNNCPIGSLGGDVQWTGGTNTRLVDGLVVSHVATVKYGDLVLVRGDGPAALRAGDHVRLAIQQYAAGVVGYHTENDFAAKAVVDVWSASEYLPTTKLLHALESDPFGKKILAACFGQSMWVKQGEGTYDEFLAAAARACGVPR